jgi:hypothetical protein
MPPLIIAAIIAAGATAAAAAAQGASAGDAANKQKEAAQSALDFQRQMWEQQRADQAPWLEAGKGSLADLLALTRDPSSIVTDPAYQFRMAEGQKALERSASARGMLNSGGALRGLARYSQGLASEEYGNRWNRLASLAGYGQTAAQNLGALGGQTANNMGNLYGAMGNAQSAGSVGVGNAISGGIGTLGGIGMQYGLSHIPTQGMGAYGSANPATTMINPGTMPNPYG